MQHFSTSHHIEDMIYMPDEIILARMMTALDLEFEKAMHYHDEGNASNNDYRLPSHIYETCHCLFSFYH